MKNILDFIQLYRLYRKSHSRRYSAWIAREIAFRGLPF